MLGSVGHSLAGTPPPPSRPDLRSNQAGIFIGIPPLFVVDRNICNFLWYGGVEGGAGEGLRSAGEEALPSSKSVCSILPITRLFYGPRNAPS
jgi:hypothetical protein